MPSLRQSIKAATGQSVWLRYAFLAPWRLAYAARATLTHQNVSGDRSSTDDVQQYAKRTFAFYKTWSGLDHFYGRVAEVGPGNVSAIARMFLDDGCSHVDQVEKFAYSMEGSDRRIKLHLEPAEQFFAEHVDYDFIVSCAVMEHLTDPLRALRTMAAALKPGGMMIHWVDCRDHNQFSDCFHDLSFLRIPSNLYWPLTLASGLNRIRLSAYLSTLAPMGFDCKVLVTALSGIPDLILPAKEFNGLDPALLEQSRKNLADIRPRLAEPFRDMPDEELMVAQFVLVATKPSNGASR
jgi:SAM-dependent methyltransferase